MSEGRPNDATQIITTVTGPQPPREQEGADDKETVLRTLESTGPVTQELKAQVSAHILNGDSVAETLDALRERPAVGKAPVASTGRARVQPPKRGDKVVLGQVQRNGDGLRHV